MQDIYVNSNKGIVFKLVVSLEQGVIINKRKPSQIRVDLFQNFRFKFDITWFALWPLAQKEVLNLLHTYL